jgi:Spherulation-specific family 4
VNPSSGPGTSQYPNDDYTTQIQQLNAYQNVNTLGYVRTGYATRDITTVVSEVSTYAGWASKSGDLAMHGIFFDEAPHQFSEAAVEFMLVANEAVKNAEGLQGQKTVRDTPDLVPIRLHDHSILLTISLFRR